MVQRLANWSHSQGEKGGKKRKEEEMDKREEEICRAYFDELKKMGKNTKTVMTHLKILFNYLEVSGKNFCHLSINDVQDFQYYLTTTTTEENTVRYTHGSVLNIISRSVHFYEYLRRKGYIAENPFLDIDRVRRKKPLPRNIFSEEKIGRFLSHLKNFMQAPNLTERRQLYRTHVIVELMYATGARISEVTALKPGDVDFTRGVVLIQDSKTGKKREALLNTFAEKVLKVYTEKMREYVLFKKNRASTELLFGSKISLKGKLNKILTRESMKLSMGACTSHNFRHALGYHLLRGGCDIRYIQDILGHETLSSTQIYTKVDRKDLKRIIDSYHPRSLREK